MKNDGKRASVSTSPPAVLPRKTAAARGGASQPPGRPQRVCPSSASSFFGGLRMNGKRGLEKWGRTDRADGRRRVGDLVLWLLQNHSHAAALVLVSLRSSVRESSVAALALLSLSLMKRSSTNSQMDFYSQIWS